MESIMETVATVAHRESWNKGKIVGQKALFNPFSVRHSRRVICRAFDA